MANTDMTFTCVLVQQAITITVPSKTNSVKKLKNNSGDLSYHCGQTCFILPMKEDMIQI